MNMTKLQSGLEEPDRGKTIHTDTHMAFQKPLFIGVLYTCEAVKMLTATATTITVLPHTRYALYRKLKRNTTKSYAENMKADNKTKTNSLDNSPHANYTDRITTKATEKNDNQQYYLQ
jgi:hypothetical protein